DPGGDSRDGPDPNNPVPRPGDGTLSIVSFKIQLYRGEEAAYHGTVGVIVPAARLDDDVRIDVKLSRPAYCYLIAFNPNGDEQLVYPPDVAAAPPRVEFFRYPAVETRFFPLTDGAGVQAFVLLTSPEPLPAYQEWKARTGSAPWQTAKIRGA